MKKLFIGKYRGIPVALLTLVLLMTIGAGAVLASGYTVVNGVITVSVLEAFTVSYSWDGDAWTELPASEDPYELTITGVYPDDSHTIGIRVENLSNNTLGATLSYWLSDAPDWNGLTFDPVGPQLYNIAGGATWETTISGNVSASAVPGDYTVSFSVQRGATHP